jgi:hypothetical protein
MTLVWRPGFSGLTDADAIAYVAAVEAADGQALEFGVGRAINDFIVGCKLDGTWSAIKASCILAGARTLNGALVPLAKQPADSNPARFGTAGGWNYSRKTGLQGNGTDNYIDSGRNNNADPQNSNHLALYAGRTSSGLTQYLCGARTTANDTGGKIIAISGTNATNYTNVPSTDAGETGPAFENGASSFIGSTRSLSSEYMVRCSSASQTKIRTSGTPVNRNIWIFGSNTSATLQLPTSSRLAFYSIGESLDLALLDTRVSALITAIGAAIP